MLTRHPRPPLWFCALLVVLTAIVVRVWLPAAAAPHTPAPGVPPISFAFWGFLIEVAGLIWDGLQASYDAIVTALVFSVQFLWAIVSALGQALYELGQEIVGGFQKAWDGLRALYSDVLKPAWQKFWTLVDRVRQTVQDLFAPVFKFLRAVRDEILSVYNHVVRPILAVIDAARATLKVLEALHVAWAQSLDNALAELEQKIDAPFQFLLSKVNEVINFVNRIATADGLFQRAAFVATLWRDAEYQIASFWLHSTDPTARPAPGLRGAAKLTNIDPTYPGDQLAQFWADGTGDYADDITALADEWLKAAGVVPSSPETIQ